MENLRFFVFYHFNNFMCPCDLATGHISTFILWLLDIFILTFERIMLLISDDLLDSLVNACFCCGLTIWFTL